MRGGAVHGTGGYAHRIAVHRTERELSSGATPNGRRYYSCKFPALVLLCPFTNMKHVGGKDVAAV